MRILLLGSSGKVGKALFVRLAAHHNMLLLNRDIADFLSPDAIHDLILNYSPDLIINAAALTNIERCEERKAEAYLVNAATPAMIAVACEILGVPLIHFSTDYVFGASQCRGLDMFIEHDALQEAAKPDPVGVYGWTKRLAEQAIEQFCSRHIILRLSTVYDETHTGPLDPLAQLKRHPEKLPKVMHQICTPTSVDFIAEAVERIVEAYDQIARVSGVYHLVPSGYTTRADFLRRISGRFPNNEGIENYIAPNPRPIFSVLSNAKFQGTFGPLKTWQEDADDMCGKILSQ